MTKSELVDRIMYLAKDPRTLGRDEDPFEVVLNMVPVTELRSIQNRLEQLYLKDIINNMDDQIDDVSVNNNGLYEVQYLDGTKKTFSAGLDKDILFQHNYEYLHNGYYIRQEI